MARSGNAAPRPERYTLSHSPLVLGTILISHSDTGRSLSLPNTATASEALAPSLPGLLCVSYGTRGVTVGVIGNAVGGIVEGRWRVELRQDAAYGAGEEKY